MSQPTKDAIRRMLRPKLDFNPCAKCHSPIQWQKTAAGKRTPVNPDGTTHWATCSDPTYFRRKTARRRADPARQQQLELEEAP